MEREQIKVEIIYETIKPGADSVQHNAIECSQTVFINEEKVFQQESCIGYYAYHDHPLRVLEKWIMNFPQAQIPGVIITQSEGN